MNRLRLISFMVAVIVLGCLSLVIFRAREPRYQGRTLTEWIESAANNPDSDPERHEAENAVKQMATDAIPWLLKWAQARDSLPKAKLVNWLDLHPSFHIQINGMEFYVEKAVFGFSLLGNEAKPALPILIRWTYDTDWQRRAAGMICLEATEPDKETLLPVLLRLIQDPNRQIQLAAACILRDRYSKDAETAGLYKMFPHLKPQ
jgi:hypothetical protein